MIVYKYLPDKMYGFVQDTERRTAFFHVGSFYPGSWVKHPYCESCNQLNCDWPLIPPPPIAGEEVIVELEFDLEKYSEDIIPPRSSKITRIHTPKPLRGIIKSFDNQRGYGFIIDSFNSDHYVHKSDIIDHRIPVIGQQVMFFPGTRDTKTRACHVRLCR